MPTHNSDTLTRSQHHRVMQEHVNWALDLIITYHSDILYQCSALLSIHCTHSMDSSNFYPRHISSISSSLCLLSWTRLLASARKSLRLRLSARLSGLGSKDNNHAMAASEARSSVGVLRLGKFFFHFTDMRVQSRADTHINSRRSRQNMLYTVQAGAPIC